MAGELSEMMRKINVNEAEEEIVVFDGNDGNNDSQSCLKRTILGRIHTDRPYNFQRMKKVLSAAWRPRLPVTFQELDSNMFLVQLGHDVDLRRVMEDGPWSFERNLVVLKSVENDEEPTETEMMKVPFWIRLINMPISKRDESSIRKIAAKIGDVLEVDDTYFTKGSKHIRVKVIINIMNPLCRFVNVLNRQNIKVRVHIQYERLPNFCYWCGLLGHTEKECLTKPIEINGKTFKDWPFPENLRASNSRENVSFNVVSPITHLASSNDQWTTKTTIEGKEKRLSTQEMILHNGCMERKNGEGNLGIAHKINEGELMDGNNKELNGALVARGLQGDSNLEKKELVSQINESGKQDLDEERLFFGESLNYRPNSALKIMGQKESKISNGIVLELDAGRISECSLNESTKAQADVENTNQPKSWKRRTREETHSRSTPGTRSISSVGKRSLEELDNEDQMDVDIVKKPREVSELNSTTASAAAQHRRGQ
ncbi:hypothetical protein CTI12_AA438450 [Artemisia annua]|uniref:CCHC-type domain-containing protein n=1 Tax=Artemisia annua TaxID=35608 RepID=A0A2U1LYI0_ARTAN|nr:hypothetical protein CTI12_AA438450 [Artemisia annua]